MTFSGVVHFTLPVSDLDRSAEFYGQILNMRILLKTPRMVFLKCGDDYVILGKTRAPIKPNVEGETIVHHAFRVAPDKFDQTLEYLREKGVQILRVEDREDGVFVGRSAYLHDPDGNALEIHDARASDSNQPV